MCRWAAYIGSQVPLAAVLTEPENSIVDQSLDAQMLDMPVKTGAAFSPTRRVATSGEGYGFAWRGEDGSLAQFRDPTPAWNSRNVVNLAKHLSSDCFFAHVRAAPGRTISEQNCHPFIQNGVMFQHNGFIGDFTKMQRDLTLLVDPDLFPDIGGTTDSELCFFLALTFGLADDPVGAFQKMRTAVEEARAAHGAVLPFVATMAASDGERVTVLRTSSPGASLVEGGFKSPSLYYTLGGSEIKTHGGGTLTLPGDAQLIASEPLELDADLGEWEEFPDQSIGVFSLGEAPTFYSLDS